MSDDRILQAIRDSQTWIEANFGVYNQRRLDYRRGSLPQDSMPEHVAGSSEPDVLPDCRRCGGKGRIKSHDMLVKCAECKGTGCSGFDVTDASVADGWKKIRAHLDTARVALRGVESEMAFLVNATKRPTDPLPQPCANERCPDAKVFNMIDERPHSRQDGRCEACRKYMERNGRERLTINAYKLGAGTMSGTGGA